MSRHDDTVPLGGKVAAVTILALSLLVGSAWVAVFLYAGDRAPRSARVEGVSIAGLAPVAEDRLVQRSGGPRPAADAEIAHTVSPRLRACIPPGRTEVTWQT